MAPKPETRNDEPYTMYLPLPRPSVFPLLRNLDPRTLIRKPKADWLLIVDESHITVPQATLNLTSTTIGEQAWSYRRLLRGGGVFIGEVPLCVWSVQGSDYLVDYFPRDDWLLIVDESHITVPQAILNPTTPGIPTP